MGVAACPRWLLPSCFPISLDAARCLDDAHSLCDRCCKVRVLECMGKSAAKKIAPYFGGRKNLNELQLMMEMIQARLSDEETRQEGDRGALIQTWLKGLKRVLYQLEDLFDELSIVADMLNHKHTKGRLTKTVRFLPSMLGNGILNNRVSREAKTIMRQLRSLKENMGILRLRDVNVGDSQNGTFDVKNRRENTDSFILEEEVIGRDEDKDLIVGMLLDSDSAKDDLSIISIVGMGGLGKTALAQLVFNHRNVQQHFELLCWACISDQISTFEELAGKVLQSITRDNCKQLSTQELQSRLKLSVKEKKFMLVLDDVWDEDRERWLRLRRLLCDCKQGSKILLTTRSKVVALNMGTVEPFELKGLLEDSSWELFKSLAFIKGQEETNPNLTSIGREIVNKCGNVPLAIRTIAGFLYSKDTEEEWLHFRDSETRMIAEKENKIMSTLKLSYYHLPPTLKQCFAYCSLFPKDYNFEIQSLIWLWMAQGFVKSLENQSPYDIGHSYFMQLLRRCFFQDVKKDKYGSMVSCKMHGLIRELAKEVGDECLFVRPGEHIDDNIRHIHFDKSSYHYLQNVSQLPVQALKNDSWLLASKQMRSLFDPYTEGPHRIRLNKVFSCLKRLRVLDLQCESLPDSIGELKHLRYLRVHVKSLPHGITRLKYLQTLDLGALDSSRELPIGFSKLTNLRHLRIGPPFASDGGKNHNGLLHDMPPRIGELKHLETLDQFIVGENNGLDALSSQILTGKLRIIYKKARENNTIEAKRANLKTKKLTHLLLSWFLFESESVAETDELLENLQPPSTLKLLVVYKWSGMKFPSWGIDELPNLVHLSIFDSKRCQQIPSFSQLPHLKTLRLEAMSALEYIEDDGCRTAQVEIPYFPSLEILKLLELKSLKGWSRNEYADGEEFLQHQFFPRLLEVEIYECPELMLMPYANKLGMLQHSSLLEKLEIKYCRELELRPKTNNMYTYSWRGLKRLNHLKLSGMSKLKSLPVGIRDLTALQSLHVWDCRQFDKRRCQEPDGVDWPLIQHIPDILIR